LVLREPITWESSMHLNSNVEIIGSGTQGDVGER
jgi:hypothetical protein